VYAPSEIPRPSVVPEVPGEHKGGVATSPGNGVVGGGASAGVTGSNQTHTKPPTTLESGAPSGAVAGDGQGNGVVGGAVVGETGSGKVAEGEVAPAQSEVPWDALSPGSKPSS